MKNKKVIIGVVILVIVIGIIIVFFIPKKPSYTSFLTTKMFYAEEYEEEYSQYDGELDIEKGVEKIYISGITKQGNIDLTLIAPNNEEYKITITNDVKKDIDVKEDYGIWKYVIKIYPDTNGTVSISNDKINESELIQNNKFYQ